MHIERRSCVRAISCFSVRSEWRFNILTLGQFGDHWDEPLAGLDLALAERHFKSIEHLVGVLDYANLRVGGRD